jgi:hypothetical protein
MFLLLLLSFLVELSDVTFQLGPNGEELYAHKFFLMTSSPIFHRIFFESNICESPVYKISMVNKPTMMEICRYAYSNTVKLTKENMLDILFAATKFQMNFLVEKVVDYICAQGFNENTIFRVLEINENIKNIKLNMKCFEYVKENRTKFFNSLEVMKLKVETFTTLLNNCELSPEIIRHAIDFWSKNPANNVNDLNALISLSLIHPRLGENDLIVIDSDDNISIASSTFSNVSKTQQNNDRRKMRLKIDLNKVKKQMYESKQAINLECEKFASRHNISFDGTLQIRHFKFSNLDVDICSRIAITDIIFTYDLALINDQVEFKIFDVTQKHTRHQLHIATINFNNKFKNPTRYTLSKPCTIERPSKLWFSLEFTEVKSRPTFVNSMMFASDSPFIVMRERELKPGNSGSSGQIISNIVFLAN